MARYESWQRNIKQIPKMKQTVRISIIRIILISLLFVVLFDSQELYQRNFSYIVAVNMLLLISKLEIFNVFFWRHYMNILSLSWILHGPACTSLVIINSILWKFHVMLLNKIEYNSMLLWRFTDLPNFFVCLFSINELLYSYKRYK